MEHLCALTDPGFNPGEPEGIQWRFYRQSLEESCEQSEVFISWDLGSITGLQVGVDPGFQSGPDPYCPKLADMVSNIVLCQELFRFYFTMYIRLFITKFKNYLAFFIIKH